MKHLLLACSALFLVPLLSGCCSCGCNTDPCNSPYGGSYSSANYSGCLPAATGTPVNTAASGGCSNCQADNSFSLPPLDSEVQSYSATPTYGQPIYGQPTYGPEVVGPQFLPADAQWAPQAAPPVPGSPTPVAPASPYSVNGSNVLMPPAPIPAVNTTVIPSPNPYSPASQSQPSISSGPMVPPTPPPPPAPPISQMQFRTSS